MKLLIKIICWPEIILFLIIGTILVIRKGNQGAIELIKDFENTFHEIVPPQWLRKTFVVCVYLIIIKISI